MTSPLGAARAAAAALLVLAAAGCSSDPAPAAAGEPQPGPVLLVTGYGGGVESLLPLEAALERAGRDARVVPVVADGTGDLRQQAAALGAAVEAALAEGSASVDVVGFSAGGVVARLWAEGLEDGDVLRRAVTLGSPHAGTELAQLALSFSPEGCVDACAQLVPGSELLAALGSDAPEAGEWASLWTVDDRVVTPPESGRLDGAALAYAVQDVCPGRTVEHGGLPRDPAVQQMVLAALAGDEPSRPDGEVC